MVIRWWPITFYPNYERDQLINGYKNKNELKFKFIISEFKDDYWDNTKSKEDNKKRQGGCKGWYKGKHCKKELILIIIIKCKWDILFSW